MFVLDSRTTAAPSETTASVGEPTTNATRRRADSGQTGARAFHRVRHPRERDHSVLWDRCVTRRRRRSVEHISNNNTTVVIWGAFRPDPAEIIPAITEVDQVDWPTFETTGGPPARSPPMAGPFPFPEFSPSTAVRTRRRYGTTRGEQRRDSRLSPPPTTHPIKTSFNIIFRGVWNTLSPGRPKRRSQWFRDRFENSKRGRRSQ